MSLNKSKQKLAVLIPTYNAGKDWETTLKGINAQTLKADLVAIIDSGSTDETVATAAKYGIRINHINKTEFSHGFARDKLIKLYPGFDIYLFLTQDAIPQSADSFENLLSAFENPLVGLAFGRQLPAAKANSFEINNRTFNYPEISYLRSKNDIAEHGFKTIFCSNSFSAYRATAYNEANGFSLDSFFGEDTLLAAKMIQLGYSIAYQANATVIHSHNFSIRDEFKRSFEIGMFHRENYWLIKDFGKPAGEGIKLLLIQLRNNPLQTFNILYRFAIKYTGYKLGFNHSSIPHKLQQSISLSKVRLNKDAPSNP